MKQINVQKFIKKYLLLIVIFFSVCLVATISAYRILMVKPTYIYAKIKIGQGLWWVETAKPYHWFINAIKKGSIEKNLIGKPMLEVINTKYYFSPNNNQYDIYLTVKIMAIKNNKSQQYNFKRVAIGVGSPIDLELPSAQVSGTIIQLSDKPIVDEYVEKTITLIKSNGYSWEYEAIHIDDKYFDGKQDVFKIIDKKSSDNIIYSRDMVGNILPFTFEPTKYIEVKAKIKLKNINNQWVYGEEQIVKPGKTISFNVSGFTFLNYTVASIE